jgi:argininosuccinate lyase
MKLYIKHETSGLRCSVVNLQRNIIKKSEKNINVIIPFYTHLQRAQPILASHYLLAFFEMFLRDIERIDQTIDRMDQNPLGACAGSGTSFNIDRAYTSKKLGFKEATRNSIDSVSDRDYVIDTIYSCSLLMMHLSRFCEDLINWNSSEFNFIKIGDEFTTGSSIMPQKKNPDILELIRGKCSLVYGNLISIMTNLKGLPLSYNRDLQEDKAPLFSAIKTTSDCVQIFSKTFNSIEFNTEHIAEKMNVGFLTATDLADYLAKNNVPFREAHHMTGNIVAYCEKKKKTLDSLSLVELQKFSKIIQKDVFNYITIEKSVSSKTSFGGTSKANVKKMITKYKKILSK